MDSRSDTERNLELRDQAIIITRVILDTLADFYRDWVISPQAEIDLKNGVVEGAFYALKAMDLKGKSKVADELFHLYEVEPYEDYDIELLQQIFDTVDFEFSVENESLRNRDD
jgi:hypothetical protein